MKRIAIALALAAVLALPAVAGDAAKASGAEVTLKGWISDSDCGAKNANAKGADCVKTCIKNGAKAVLVAGEKIYTIKGDGKAYMEQAGKELEVTGIVTGDTIEIKKIVPAGTKA